MAKTYQLSVVAASTGTQADLDTYGHSLLFADSIVPIYTQAEAGTNVPAIVVTSNIDSTSPDDTFYQLLADDSQAEVSLDISMGKFVAGNLIAVWCTTAEAQSDLRSFVTYFAVTGDIHLHIGVCNTTQSQDYTPNIVANSRALKMLSPAQVSAVRS
jgi:hypothetical protein